MLSECVVKSLENTSECIYTIDVFTQKRFTHKQIYCEALLNLCNHTLPPIKPPPTSQCHPKPLPTTKKIVQQHETIRNNNQTVYNNPLPTRKTSQRPTTTYYHHYTTHYHPEKNLTTIHNKSLPSSNYP